MRTTAIAEAILGELLTVHDATREPEPAALMTDEESVRAFHEAGRSDGALAPMRVYHALHVSELVAPGDVVLDLGCGPCDQLALLARAHPRTRFIGVDLSPEMLHVAAQRLAGLGNAAATEGDITRLSRIPRGSVDCVYSTVVLHHLPNEAALAATFREVHRVLKPGGRVYLADFGRLRSPNAMEIFADAQRQREPAAFVTDYLNSLRAAFSLEEWRRSLGRLAMRGELTSTALIPFMVTLKSMARRAIDDRARITLAAAHDAMPAHRQKDFADLVRFARLGGLAVPSLRRRASGSARPEERHA